MCGVVDGGISAGPLGLRGRAERRRRHLRLVRRARRAARLPRRGRRRGHLRARRCSPSWPPRRRSASTGWSRSTGTAATARCWSTTSCPGVVVGQTLATRPEDIYRALLEATAFGTRTIIEAFVDAGVPVTELVVAGGLLKNALLMQIYADVTGLPLSTIGSAQGPALGSAIHAAVAAGAYPDIRAAASGHGLACAAASTSRIPSERRGLRRALRRVPDPARLLRPRRQRRDAPAQGPPPGRRRRDGGRDDA